MKIKMLLFATFAMSALLQSGCCNDQPQTVRTVVIHDPPVVVKYKVLDPVPAPPPPVYGYSVPVPPAPSPVSPPPVVIIETAPPQVIYGYPPVYIAPQPWPNWIVVGPYGY